MNLPDRSQGIRIGANYAQLLGSFLIGLFVVRILLGLGESVYGVIAVLVAGTGLARLLREVLQVGLVPKLGAAWTGNEDGEFSRVYPSSIVVATACAGLTLLGFSILGQVLGWFDIPDSLRRAASVFVWLKGVQSAVSILTAPTLTMLLVREKFVAHNTVVLAERSLDLVAALATLVVVGSEVPGRAITFYAITVTAGSVLLHIGVTGFLAIRNRSLRPDLSSASRTGIRAVTTSLSWNAVHAVAMNLHLRLDVLIMNGVFGLAAGMLFSIAGQAASYVRQLAMGLVIGVDALSARHRRRDQPNQLRSLVKTQMALQAAIILPAAGALFIAAEDLIGLWLRGRLENPDESLPEIALFCRILLAGVVARSLSESWISTLTGTGNARRFAPLVLAGALANPFLIFLGISLIDDPGDRLIPAICFSAIFAMVHLILIPRVAARFLEVGFSELFRPALVPLAAASLGGIFVIVLNHFAMNAVVQLAGFLLVYTFSLGGLARIQFAAKPAASED